MTIYADTEVRLKACTACRVVRPLDRFAFESAGRPARRTVCKVCNAARKQSLEYRSSEAQKARNRRRLDPAYAAQLTEQGRKHASTPKGRANRMYLAAEQRAGVLGLEFTVEQDWIEAALVRGVCERTYIPFSFDRPAPGLRFNPYAPSLDRIDPFKGYTADNVQVVCNAYNLGKNQFTDAQFLAFCKRVVAAS